MGRHLSPSQDADKRAQNARPDGPLSDGKLRVLDLFSGIGGFSLGLERTGGFQPVAFCDNSKSCRKLLAQHWPGVPIYEDVRFIRGERLRRERVFPRVICGGFPCQDISLAGAGAGLAGARSGLWSEFYRIICEVRPDFVIVENVAALLGRGLGRVLGDLAEIGYDAWWDCIPASAVGAPHRRDRIWIVAYARGKQHEGFGDALRRSIAAQLSSANPYGPGEHDGPVNAEMASPSAAPAYTAGGGHGRDGGRHLQVVGAGGEALADADLSRLEGRLGGPSVEAPILPVERHGQGVADAARLQPGWPQQWPEWQRIGSSGQPIAGGPAEWLTEPDVGRVAHGIPSRVDRLHGLGNAVVPQIPELIGRAILEAAA